VIKTWLGIISLVFLFVANSCVQPETTLEPVEPKAPIPDPVSEASPEGTGDEINNMRNYRQDMRDFVKGIGVWARKYDSDFIVVPQNGSELLSKSRDDAENPDMSYLGAIDGVGREDLFYGYDDDDIATPLSEREDMTAFMDMAEANGVEVLTIDYCSTISFIDDSYYQNSSRGYLSFAANHRELDNIPEYPVNPFNTNSADITSLAEAKNFLYLINPGEFSSQIEFLKALRNTNYDVLIIDAYFDEYLLTVDDVAKLKIKADGGARLVLAYMSIGEAEEYRYYWQNEWRDSPPSWLAEENPDWPGNHKVRFWDPAWQEIIYGNNKSYLGLILDAGFDGVYLDIIDAFEYFENTE